MPTASAIVSDLLRASSTPVHRYPTFITDPANADGLQKNDDWALRFLCAHHGHRRARCAEPGGGYVR